MSQAQSKEAQHSLGQQPTWRPRHPTQFCNRQKKRKKEKKKQSEANSKKTSDNQFASWHCHCQPLPLCPHRLLCSLHGGPGTFALHSSGAMVHCRAWLRKTKQWWRWSQSILGMTTRAPRLMSSRLLGSLPQSSPNAPLSPGVIIQCTPLVALAGQHTPLVVSITVSFHAPIRVCQRGGRQGGRDEGTLARKLKQARLKRGTWASPHWHRIGMDLGFVEAAESVS